MPHKSGVEDSATAGVLPDPIELPPPQTDGGRPLMKVLKDRKSVRQYRSEKLSEQVLSNLLWAAFGINRPESGKRTAPSALNWQETDIYVALENGLYLYNAEKHRLNPILSGDVRAQTTRSFQPQRKSIENAPVTLIYVADAKKTGMTGRLTNDRDREIFAAAATGHISQNVYLFCASEGLGTVIRGLLDKKRMKEMMKLGPEQNIILAQSIGYPKKKTVSVTSLDLSRIPDGIYKGEFTYNETVHHLEVMVKKHLITDIRILDIHDTETAAEAGLLIQGIIDAQSTDVDAVSGATAGSETLLEAVRNAIMTTCENH